MAKKILTELIELQKAYAFTHRVLTTQERYVNLIEAGLIKDFSYDSLFLREPLLEHVGHLPIIAAHLHRYLEKRCQVDLGRALVMLSIHDIGELATGDAFFSRKNKKLEKDEHSAAKEKLPSYLFDYFEEFEKRETFDAKFAKSIDSLAPQLHELALPRVTLERFKHFGFDTDKIAKHKEKYFTWDKTLVEIFNSMIKQYREMETDTGQPSADSQSLTGM